MITITNKTILDAFMTPKKWHQDHLHNKLIKGEVQVDTNQALDSLEGLLDKAYENGDTSLYDVLKDALKALER